MEASCPKCSALRAEAATACPRCGVAVGKMAAFAARADHDELLRRVSQHDAYVWAVARYRSGPPTRCAIASSRGSPRPPS